MISKINIRNFKSIKDASIELKPLNILIGANGAGKSNFISLFEFLKNIYEQNLQQYVRINGGADNILYYGSKESDYLFIERFFEDEFESNYVINLLPKKVDSLFIEKEIIQLIFCAPEDDINPSTKLSYEYKNILESKIKDETKTNYLLTKHIESFEVFHFHDTSSTAKVKKTCNINDNQYLRDDASNLAAYLYLLKNNFTTNFKLIENTIKSVAPFFKEFDLHPMALNPELIKLEWKETGSDKYFDASSISDGTLRFICLTALLLQANLPKTIIIDEPELGLHPFAINKLAGMLKSASSKSQIIVSTQSVNLLEKFSPEDIIVVDRNDRDSQFRRLSENELKDWLEDYSLGELWEKNIIGGRP